MSVVFHNWQNYDLNLTLQEIGKYSFKISILPKAMEK